MACMASHTFHVTTLDIAASTSPEARQRQSVTPREVKASRLYQLSLPPTENGRNTYLRR